MAGGKDEIANRGAAGGRADRAGDRRVRWLLLPYAAGLVLLVLFYNVVGLAQNALRGRIGRRILLEYGLITIAAMALIWEFAP